MKICSICNKDTNSILYKCNNCDNLFHQKCIKKWLRINTDYELIYRCAKCSFIGFNDNDLSYKPLLNDYNNDERWCCKIC